MTLVAWSIRLEMVVKANTAKNVELDKLIKKLSPRLDTQYADLQILQGKMDIVGSMMSPERQREHWTTMENMRLKIEFLGKSKEK